MKKRILLTAVLISILICMVILDPLPNIKASILDINKSQNIICISKTKSGQDELRVSVNAKNFTKNIFGIGFDLNFDESALKFIKFEKGNFFEHSGEPFYIAEGMKNKIVTGITLKRGNKPVKGSGALIGFYFKVIDNSAGNFSFANQIASAIFLGKRKDIKNVNWVMKCVEE